ncbi:phosphate regulon sensor histidine kinase PhoR [Gammaproteobacteria bacterium 45_16_T64]|nr:phosphate regulon sensor histidine kinase PhoR [Gammaproteobacteria bacterium 45_16_T64]
MYKHWQLELNKFLLICIIGGSVGWLVGEPWAGAFLCLFLYISWLLLYLKELASWLEDPQSEELPEASGLWGFVFDKLYRQRKKHKTKTKKLKKTIEKSRLSTNAIQDAVVLINEDDLLEWWNKAAKKHLGLMRNTDRSQPIINLLRDPAFITYYERGEYRDGIHMPSPVNPAVTLHVTLSYFSRTNRILIARDVTRLIHLEQMRKDFVGNVSHELRTPLTVIKGYIETFLDLFGSNEHPALHRGLTQIDQQTRRMEILVNDLLLLSRLETDASKTPHEPINVVGLLQRIQQDAKALNTEKNHTIQLVIDHPVGLLGDMKELQNAFSNIIFNAIKYTDAGGIIEIRWWKDSDGAHLSVIDNGVGIDPIHIPRLTERFYRADPSRQTASGGTGLGLAIVKHSLRHHEGVLDIQSGLGEGSHFSCHFPKRRTIKPPIESH